MNEYSQKSTYHVARWTLNSFAGKGQMFLHALRWLLLPLLLTSIFLAVAPAHAIPHCFAYRPGVGYLCDEPYEVVASLTEDSVTTMATRIVDESAYEAYVKLNGEGLVYPEPNSMRAPLYDLGQGFVFVNVTAVLEELVDDTTVQRWYRINANRYIKAEAVEREVRPSSYQGRHFAEQPVRPFGWIVSGVRPSSQPGGPANDNLPFLPRYHFFQVYGAAHGGDGWLWYDVGNGAWIQQTRVSLIDPKPRPGGVGEAHYWVEVDLYEQTFAAYQGSRLVYAGLISSGLSRTPTRHGLFQVWSRHTRAKMSGFEGWPEYYYLQNVPHIQYFDGDIGLHGAYWHDRFGFRASRGCVNMAPKDAEWLFSWSARGPNTLWVWVHSSNPHHYFDRYH
jgi:hypothetical protein